MWLFLLQLLLAIQFGKPAERRWKKTKKKMAPKRPPFELWLNIISRVDNM